MITMKVDQLLVIIFHLFEEAGLLRRQQEEKATLKGDLSWKLEAAV